MAQLNACPTGDQEVVGSIPAQSTNILSCWFKKGICQFLEKEYAQVLVNRLED